ncbi:MAG: family 16 glycoside hydrolase [Flavobacteriaceae bacterium]
MKNIRFLLLLMTMNYAVAQNHRIPLALDSTNTEVFNREVSFDEGVVYLDVKPNAGFLWFKGIYFKNGRIELDIKGRDVKVRSFVGVAFHAQDQNTYESVYFRPFNFNSPQMKTHAVQYISIPGNDWYELRQKYPDKYEAEVVPPPGAEDWFHVSVVVDYPNIKVYVNDAEKPCLEVNQISTTQEGKLGLWLGNNSNGWFKNIRIYPAD